MKGASASEYFEYFKMLAGVKHDYELGPILGKKKSAISEAKRRGQISPKMLAAASYAFKMTLEELEAGLVEFQKTGQVHKCVFECGQIEGQNQLYWDAWQQTLEENRQLSRDKEALYREKETLYREKEVLMKENSKLRVQVARLEEQLKVAQGGGYSDKATITIAEDGARAAG